MSCDYVLCCARANVFNNPPKLSTAMATPELFKMNKSGWYPIWKADYNIVKQPKAGDHLAARQGLDHKISLTAVLRYTQVSMSWQHLEI